MKKTTGIIITLWLITLAPRANSQDSLFAPPVTYGVGDNPYSVFSCDFDGDSDNDLAVANYSTDNVSILLNNGDGTFQATVDYGAGDRPHSVFSCDLDNDNDNDLALANTYSHDISILLNNGDGTFQAAVNYGAGDYPLSVFSCDFDGDNDNDLAVANLGLLPNWDGKISVMFNNGDGTFQTAINYGVGNAPGSVFSCNYDNDDDFDLAVVNNSSGDISILINNGNGTFQAAVNFKVEESPVSIFSKDFDGDNDYDLAVTNISTNNVSILFNLTNTPGCCNGIRGDVDGDEDDLIDIADLVYFVEYSFSTPPGPEPLCFEEADVDGSGELNIADIVFIVYFIFGPPPGPEWLDCPSYSDLYQYSGYDSTGIPIVQGWIDFIISDTNTITGTWELEAIGDPQMIGPQIGSGELIGDVIFGEIVINLNPNYFDYNVYLHGYIVDNVFSGNWEYIGIMGVMNYGSFTAIRQ